MNTTKAKTAAFWGTTGLLSFALFGSGFAKVTGAEQIVQNMTDMGYPAFFLPILGVWYLAAAAAILAPALPRVKEWAYAGVFFAMSGAVVSHLAVGHGFGEAIPGLGIAGLAVASYLLRPASRRLDAPAPAEAPTTVPTELRPQVSAS